MKLQHLLFPVFVAILAVPGSLPAQDAARCGNAPADSTGAGPLAIVRASASIDEITFESQPDVVVRVDGCEGVSPVRVVERTNLPDPVQPGVTYRDVNVAVEISAYLQIECLLDDPIAAPADPAGAGAGSAQRDLCGEVGAIGAQSDSILSPGP